MKMRPAINLGLFCAVGLAAGGAVLRAEAATLGAGTCSTSGCHGGAGDRSDQFAVWSQLDAHSRSFATLTTARAARMAEALAIPDPSSSPRCVVCHAPLAGVSPSRLGTGAGPEEGVSCASCHGAPDRWLRGHTRSDWTHADRVAAGMRDLDDLYTRANTCVACHQGIDPALVNVGRHPALIFELDGQTQDEPKHWRERAGGLGAQAWFVGQAVALREVSWALLNARADAARSVPEWRGLGWLLSRTGLDFGAGPVDCS
ncbi:MAG TPA: multiheme c-type cytochrome, partial [Opitutaceae bacterium]|nr:multiheme c-type cytochrome [Opitutaceae bacterium]